jgi:hypothetical protein
MRRFVSAVPARAEAVTSGSNPSADTAARPVFGRFIGPGSASAADTINTGKDVAFTSTFDAGAVNFGGSPLGVVDNSLPRAAEHGLVGASSAATPVASTLESGSSSREGLPLPAEAAEPAAEAAKPRQKLGAPVPVQKKGGARRVTRRRGGAGKGKTVQVATEALPVDDDAGSSAKYAEEEESVDDTDLFTGELELAPSIAEAQTEALFQEPSAEAVEVASEGEDHRRQNGYSLGMASETPADAFEEVSVPAEGGVAAQSSPSEVGPEGFSWPIFGETPASDTDAATLHSQWLAAQYSADLAMDESGHTADELAEWDAIFDAFEEEFGTETVDVEAVVRDAASQCDGTEVVLRVPRLSVTIQHGPSDHFVAPSAILFAGQEEEKDLSAPVVPRTSSGCQTIASMVSSGCQTIPPPVVPLASSGSQTTAVMAASAGCQVDFGMEEHGFQTEPVDMVACVAQTDIAETASSSTQSDVAEMISAGEQTDGNLTVSTGNQTVSTPMESSGFQTVLPAMGNMATQTMAGPALGARVDFAGVLTHLMTFLIGMYVMYQCGSSKESSYPASVFGYIGQCLVAFGRTSMEVFVENADLIRSLAIHRRDAVMAGASILGFLSTCCCYGLPWLRDEVLGAVQLSALVARRLGLVVLVFGAALVALAASMGGIGIVNPATMGVDRSFGLRYGGGSTQYHMSALSSKDLPLPELKVIEWRLCPFYGGPLLAARSYGFEQFDAERPDVLDQAKLDTAALLEDVGDVKEGEGFCSGRAGPQCESAGRDSGETQPDKTKSTWTKVGRAVGSSLAVVAAGAKFLPRLRRAPLGQHRR